jgi:hypothetical protein
MNERIIELWARAGGFFNPGCRWCYPEYTIEDPNTFTELIIRECLVECSSDATPKQIADSIRKKFGTQHD